MAGMGRTEEAVQLLGELITLDRNHAGAADLLRQIKPRPDEVAVD
jgi:hypothetical protein